MSKSPPYALPPPPSPLPSGLTLIGALPISVSCSRLWCGHAFAGRASTHLIFLIYSALRRKRQANVRHVIGHKTSKCPFWVLSVTSQKLWDLAPLSKRASSKRGPSQKIPLNCNSQPIYVGWNHTNLSHFVVGLSGNCNSELIFDTAPYKSL